MSQRTKILNVFTFLLLILMVKYGHSQTPMRITLDITSLSGIGNVAGQRFLEDATRTATEFFQTVLKVNQVPGNNIYPTLGGNCNTHATTVSDATTGIPNSDLHIYV